MSTIVAIASAVAESLNGTNFTMPFTAARLYRPMFTLAELAGLQVTVVPRANDETAADRARSQNDYQIDVAVQKKLVMADTDELDPLMALVEEIQTHFRRSRLAAYPGAAWTKAVNEPAYVPEHIDQHKVFTSVVTLTYRVLG